MMVRAKSPTSPGPPKNLTPEQQWSRFFRQWNWTGAKESYLERVRERLGERPEDRLRWVLRISAPAAVDALREGEHGTLGDDLRACAYLALAPTGGGFRLRLDAMTPRELREHLEAISTGLCGLTAAEPQPWRIPAEPVLILQDGTPMIRFSGDERQGILGGIAHLVVEVGDKFRGCLECHAPFVAERRQTRYCSARCIDRKWNRERKPTTTTTKRSPR
jgi:hypothetical protein